MISLRSDENYFSYFCYILLYFLLAKTWHRGTLLAKATVSFPIRLVSTLAFL